MAARSNNLKAWLPATLSVASVLLSSAYAATRHSQAADGIRNLQITSSTLNTASAVAQGGVLSQQDEEALNARYNELEQRLKDSRQPALVQAQLVEFARSLDLEVREVQPIADPSKKSGSSDLRAYRVMVAGQYAQIASYMSALPKQRIPARVIALRLGAHRDDETGVTIGLSAEFTVEVFNQFEPRADQAASAATEVKQ
jgi:hypothetical protein